MRALDIKKINYLQYLFLPILILSTLPIFYDEIRVILANAVSRDAYENLNANIFSPNTQTISPYAYRLIPIFLIEYVDTFKMPTLFTFTSAISIPPEIYNKRFSIALISYVFQILYSTLIYLELRYSKRLSQTESGLGFYLGYTTIHFTAIYGIDTITIFVLFLIYILIDHKKYWLFLIISFISIITNEKIIIISAIYIFLFLGPNKALFSKYFYTLLIAFLTYLLLKMAYPIPGHEYQLTFVTYLPSLHDNIHSIWITLRGGGIVLIPFILSTIFFILSSAKRTSSFRLVFFPLILLLLGGALNLSYSNGRFIAHVIPFAIVPFIMAFSSMNSKLEPHET